jgi:ribosomal protein L37AE/L43A
MKDRKCQNCHREAKQLNFKDKMWVCNKCYFEEDKMKKLKVKLK